MIDRAQKHDRPVQGAPEDLPLDDLLDRREALELAIAQLDLAINAHKVANLRSMVHLDRPDEDAQARIRDLQKRRRELLRGLERCESMQRATA